MKANRKIGIIGGMTAPLMFMLAADKGGKSGGSNVATGTGAAPATDAKADTKTKPEVTVHKGLLELFKKHDGAAEKAATYLVEIGETVVKDNVSNAVLIKTIMEARGTTESSAKSQASRIRSLLKDTDSFEALRRGEVTVRAAVKTAQTRRQATPVSNQKAFDNAVARLVPAAKALGQDRKTILVTLEAALEKGGVK